MATMPRLFVAAWPDARTSAALRALPRPDEPGIRWIPASNLHITLRFIGDASTDDVVHLLRDVALPRPIAALGPTVERLGPRLLVLPARGVDELAHVVRAATIDIGAPDDRSFRGHITVARTKRGARSTAVGVPFAVTWTVDEVVLVASVLSPAGPIYTTVASFPTA
jgi:2'-5' RNA ligase